MLRNRTIEADATLLDAMKKMDFLDKKLLLVLNGEKFGGLISIGDIQRAIIQNRELTTPVMEVLRKNIRIGKPDDSYDLIRQMMIDFRMELCPVVDEEQNIIRVYFWEDLFTTVKPEPARQFNLPVIIMAGGIGSRLKPITNVLPKPLIPIDERTIVEHIFERFSKHGCNHFYMSVNFKAELIEFYLKNQQLPYQIEYFREEKPSGTAGSLSLLKGKINERFFVSNCDILIEQDYSEILDYHLENKNEITLVAVMKHYSIPYGTIETAENGSLLNLTEKPEISYKINSGMYILEPHLLDEIPENEFFHITDLIEKVLKREGRAGVFPVSEKSWRDIGDWDNYLMEK